METEVLQNGSDDAMIAIGKSMLSNDGKLEILHFNTTVSGSKWVYKSFAPKFQNGKIFIREAGELTEVIPVRVNVGHSFIRFEKVTDRTPNKRG